MTAKKLVYFPLLWLHGAWADQSGLSPEVVLRRIAHWVVCGGFSEAAFVDRLGEPVDPLEIYWAVEALIDSHSGARSAGGAISPLASTGRTLAQARITSTDLLAFCAATDTEPPASMFTHGWLAKILRAFNRPANLAPPPCPGGEARATELSERRICAGVLGHSKAVLDRLEKLIAAKPAEEPVVHVRYAAEWDEDRRRIEQMLDRYENPELREHLASLKEGWASLFQSTALVDDYGPWLPDEPDAAAEIVDADAETVRLRIRRSSNTAWFDRQALALADLPMRLLCILAREAQAGDAFVPLRRLEDELWGKSLSTMSRPGRDVVRDLRVRLKSLSPPVELIETRTAKGYRLKLAPSEIVFEEPDAAAATSDPTSGSPHVGSRG
jgi:hypothetical protein